MTTKVNLQNIIVGDTKRYEFRFTNINITNWTIWFTVKNTNNDADISSVLQYKTTAGDDASDDPVNGLMYVEVPSNITDIVEGSYYYDFQRVIEGTNPPNVKTLAYGRIKFIKGTTVSVA